MGSRRRATVAVLAALALWVGSVSPAGAASGDLDTTWSGDGVLPFASRYNITLGAYGTDGSIFTGSWKATDGNGPMRISRFNADGTPSAGWGSSGYVLRAFEPGGHGVSFPTEVIRVGLRVTVVGEHHRNTARLGVARLRSDGSYDTAFSGDGRALYRVFPEEHDVVTAFRAQVLTGGKIGLAIVGLDFDSNDDLRLSRQAMVRLNANGSMDTTFSGDGLAIVPNSWSDIHWLPNGGSFAGNQGSISHQVRKLLPSGQADTSFSGDGVVSAACGSHRGANMGIDTTGRPLLQCVKPMDPDMHLAMYRFTTSGAFDSTYSGDGKTTWIIPGANGEDAELRLTFDSAGKPWVATSSTPTSNTLRVFTLDSNGDPDAAYSDDGMSEVVLPGPADLSGVWHIAGRLYVTTFKDATTVQINALDD
jgi:uncharacterized delta-60 repeat protein